MSPAQTRIITGTLKGRALQLPNPDEARPTRGRIRQAAFNILQGYTDFEGLTVAELCCGSGAWGLEALSRGAAKVYLVDTDPRCAQRNGQVLGVGNQVLVIKADAAAWVPHRPVDLLLADPPYGNPALLQAMLVNAARLGKPGALWLLETAAEMMPPWPADFIALLSRTYGTSALHLARQSGENNGTG
jgi:16S rRNA (guanine966-N2)-methyltransferase